MSAKITIKHRTVVIVIGEIDQPVILMNILTKQTKIYHKNCHIPANLNEISTNIPSTY